MKKATAIALLLLLVIVSFALTPLELDLYGTKVLYFAEYFDLYNEVTAFDEAEIAWVTDGDTVNLIRSKTLKLIEKVRLIGLDTPETVHPSKPVEEFGREASDFAKNLLNEKNVRLSYDWDPRDRYNRILGYLWLPVEYSGETRYVLFNLLAIINGYGHAYTSFSFNENYMQTFLEAETYARDNSLGLWGLQEAIIETPVEETKPGYDPTVFITNTGTKYHREGCRYLKDSKIALRLSEAKRRGYTPCSVCNPPQ